MRNTSKMTTLENKFPLLAVEQGCIISKDADITVAFEVDLPELYTVTGAEYEAIHGCWCKAIKVLPDFSVVHKQDWFIKEKYTPELQKEDMSFLSRSFERHFNERPYLKHTCYLYLTKTTKERNRMQSNFSTLCRGHIIPKELDKETAGKFMEAAEQFERIMNDSGFVRLRRLSTDEIVGTEKSAGLIERYFSLMPEGNATLQDIDLSAREMRIGDNRLCLHTLSDAEDMPGKVATDIRYEKLSTDRSDCRLSFASPVGLLLSCNHIYNQYVIIDNSEENLQKFEKSARNMQSLSRYSRSNSINREWIDQYLNEAHSYGLTSVRAHFNVMAWSNDAEELKHIKNDVGSQLASMECVPRHNTIDCPTLYWAAMPGNAADFPAEESFHTFIEQAVCLFTEETNYRSSLSPFGIKMVDRLTGKPLHLDISDLPMKRGITTNRNKFVLGPSGSGKSFHMNSVVRQLWEQNTDIVMVDTGNSYEGLCEYVGGKYIAYTEDKPITMNPFNISKRELNIEKIDFLKNLILLIWKGSETQIPELEFRVVEQLVTEYYDFYFNGVQPYPSSQKETLRKNLSTMEKRRGTELTQIHDKVEKLIKGLEERRMALSVKTLSFDSFYEFACERLDQICIENNITTIDCDNFAYMLQNFYRGGKYDKILNENVDSTLFDETFIVFEVDAIKENKQLFPIVTLIIMDVFLQKMRLKKNRKCLVIEEAWKAIASPLMAEYIKYLYKTARKFWASVGVVTQEIQDIIGSPIVKEAIINNSDVVMLLDQSKFRERFDEIKAILGLTDVDCKKIFTVNRLDNKEGRSFFREVFIRRGSTSGVYGVEEPHECYMTYTTERAEKEALKLYKHELKCRHQEAIERYCRDWDASGIGKSLAFAQKVNEAGHVLNLTDDGATRR